MITNKKEIKSRSRDGRSSNVEKHSEVVVETATEREGYERQRRMKLMTEERKKWLREALDSIVLNETKRIQDIVTVLEYEPSGEMSTKEEERKTMNFIEIE